ncbi:DUF885 domain-containing protein [Rhodohalobacter sulfatireducens]|uniref:DUF885 domain-containing protein n=1 Tax=Rhodohalobacter sulfatireducens TaxID=2911366 RepID=A0ABS9K9S8_9BACT|nr:DUF885 domain-containing protein [Rhodohalobacter sulfatireducens]MCG2587585.1 DUF885 domain-containing protein [Rhodohalobacter sulfatireducens]
MYSSIFILLILFIQSPQLTDHEQLRVLFDDYWEYSLQSSPVFATSQGDDRFNDQLAETGLDAMKQSYEKSKGFLDRLYEISRDELSDQNQVNYDIIENQLEGSLRAYELNHHLLPLNGWWDYHASFATLGDDVPLDTVEDYDNYLSRLRGFPEYNAGYIERMRKGVELGVMRPRIVFDDYVASIEALITEKPEEHRLFEPFESYPDNFSDDEKERLTSQAKEVMGETVIPEFQRLRNFLVDVYIPNTTETIGITEIPGGEEYYNYLIQDHTTIDITADEVYQIGLEEVQRIRAEMMQIVKSEGYGDDFDGFVEFLRTDDQFYAETADELLKETAFVLKSIDGKLPELFKTLPRLPYGIEPIPDYLAPRTTTAYYSRGNADGTEAGTYAVNTYDLDSRPLYEIPALSLHEAVPGHHLQIALQQELNDLPKFRTNTGFSAFTEGWALYAERLGEEIDMYETPYNKFGQLSYEMWRALRLVVDTGMHAKGWSRDEAIQYMADNSALSLHNIRSEVNRYIFWPGQALGYKMGEIKIRELRAMAEEKLGENFNLREFHDVVLLSGSIPLSVLEGNVLQWIRSVGG